MRRYRGRVLLSPTDLVTFVGCQHATALDLMALQGGIPAPADTAPFARLLQQKGFGHELDFVDQLEASGRTVVRIPDIASLHQRVRFTADAMRVGADVIYQGILMKGGWHGITDFLMRTETPSALGPWSYEVADTKLAAHVSPRHVIQLTLYSGLLAHIQGVRPRQMAVVLGNGSTEFLRPDDFSHYVRLAGWRLQQFVVAGANRRTAPEPCGHCQICRWKSRCEAEWEATDHLSLVANIRRSQRDKLCAAGVNTTAALAAVPADQQVPGMAEETIAKLRIQARLQVSVRGTGGHRFQLLPLEPGRGFSRLPLPDPGDLFFDLEGDPLFQGGLEYLFGLRVGSEDGGQYLSWWAHDRTKERQAVESVLDYIAAHLAHHPGAFIYHYGNYEVAALRRLVMRHGTREAVVDDLLRGQQFIDLYAVVREALQISEPRYSLKNVERFFSKGFRQNSRIDLAQLTVGDSQG